MKKLFLFTILLSCLGINYAYSMDNTRVFAYKKGAPELEELKGNIKYIFHRFPAQKDIYIKNDDFDSYLNSIHKLTISEIDGLNETIKELEYQEYYDNNTEELYKRIDSIVTSAKIRPEFCHSLQCLAIKKLSHLLSVKQINKLNIPHVARKKLLKKLQAKSPKYAYEYAKMGSLKEKAAAQLLDNQLNQYNKIDKFTDLITAYDIILPKEIRANNEIILQQILKEKSNVNIPAKTLFDQFAIFFIHNHLIPLLDFNENNTLPGAPKHIVDEYKQNLYHTIQTSFMQMFIYCSKELTNTHIDVFNSMNSNEECKTSSNIIKLITIFNRAKNQYIAELTHALFL